MRIFNTVSFKRFKQDTSGTIAMIFGLTFIPLALACGMAIDGVYMVGMKEKIARSLDAAVLAVAAAPTSMSKKTRETIGEKTFYANLPKNAMNAASGKPLFSISGEKVTASINAYVDTSIMSLAGIDSVEFNVGAEVSIKKKKTAEIALVLDYSGSMARRPANAPGGQLKFIAMREAATKLVNDLVKLDKDKVKFGLVPFSHYVLAPLAADYVKNANYVGITPVCTQDRPYPANTTDTAPGSFDDTKWGQPDVDTDDYNCAGMLTNGLEVKPLSTDFDMIKSRLNQMRPYHRTHISLGAEFGFHVLSPSSTIAGGAEYTDATVEKYMVLLTDGVQTVSGFGPDGIRSEDQAKANLGEICSKAKGKGIKIITIAYDLNDQPTRDSLENCASDKGMFFIADDNKEIAAAFDSIKQQLVTAFYISK
jgi:Flp pilus assembly protein TadG